MTLAQCDRQLVKELVEYGRLEAQTVVRLQSSRIFQAQTKMNPDLRNCYETVKESYSRLKVYQIRHDTFGGYGLTYTGEVVIQPRTILRNGPLGYLSPVPDSVPSLSTVHLTSSQKGPHLMLGSVRFLNSDCEPICCYNFDRMDKVV